MSGVPEPIRIWSTTVPPEWSDYNGHMSEGWYGVAFGAASDELLVHLGFGAPYRDAHGTFYTAETRIRFLREVHEGATICADTWLLGADAKRLHVLHHLIAGDDPEPVIKDPGADYKPGKFKFLDEAIKNSSKKS